MGERSIRAVAVCIACTLALVMLGFAGRAVAEDDSAFAARYRLPDGSYASLCRTGHDEGALPHGKHHCALCCAAAGHAFVPPEPAFAGFFVAAVGADSLLPASTAALRHNALGHGLCRGPPSAT